MLIRCDSISDMYASASQYKGLKKDTVKPVLNGHSKRRLKIGFQDPILLNAGQKYCRMLPLDLSTFIKLPFVIKSFVLSIFTVYNFESKRLCKLLHKKPCHNLIF